MWRLAALACALACATPALSGPVRIKDLVEFDGVRGNDLVGYGLVVGLNGTGDSLRNAPFTEEMMANMLERLGVNVTGEELRPKNVAAVFVTAALPPFARAGGRIDVAVSAIGDAKSLLGGTLVMTPLNGADGQIYAVAQGTIIAGGISAEGEAARVVQGVPTAGTVPSGARVEREVEFDFASLRALRLALRSPDFTTAARIEAAINRELGRGSPAGATVLTDGAPEGLSIGAPVELIGPARIAPDDSWIGRIIDPDGQPLDGRPLLRGPQAHPLRAEAPPAAQRRRLGGRLETGVAVFDTLLPLVRGQRIGLFAGSGVGKSSLLAKFATGIQADVVVIALVGERGRELREFTERVLGPAGMARSVVITATSDQSALMRRRCAWSAMAVAEHFRDQGAHVLFLADSVTRFAEAHREVALAGGEPAALRGYPPSLTQAIMALAERAGPGPQGAGDITAVFSVLVSGSDMEEPVADILRGVLDGHVVMDRKIAERGRFPAIDLLRSVSRSLPEAASPEENALIGEARKLLGAWDRAELMIQAGLYARGSDPIVDRAMQVWPSLDAFLGEDAPQGGVQSSFARLAAILASRGV